MSNWLLKMVTKWPYWIWKVDLLLCTMLQHLQEYVASSKKKIHFNLDLLLCNAAASKSMLKKVHCVLLPICIASLLIYLFGALELFCFLSRKKVPKNIWKFPREVQHLGPHIQNKQSPTVRQTEIFLNSCRLSLQLAVLLLVIRILLILHNKTCIWKCWSFALNTSHRAFHTILLATALSSSAFCCIVASYDFQ